MDVKKTLQILTKKIDGEESESRIKCSWENILLQIILPIVLVLAFIALTKLAAVTKKLEEATKKYDDKKRGLIRVAEEYKNTERETLIEERVEAIIELQKQKILMALGELRYDEKNRLGLYLPLKEKNPETMHWRLEAYLEVSPVEKIEIAGGKLNDADWKTRFDNLYHFLHNEDSQRLQAFEYYKFLLNRTKLKDDLTINFDLFIEEIEKSTDSLGQTASVLSKPEENVCDDNRKIAWEELIGFLKEIENDTVNLQKNILDKIMDYYLEHHKDLDNLDVDGEKIIRLNNILKKINLKHIESNRENDIVILRIIEDLIRSNIEETGYQFLEKTWKYHN